MSAERTSGRRNSKFDRVVAPSPGAPTRDQTGKEALYSTAPSAGPGAQLLVVCARCDVETSLKVWQAWKLFKPPFVPHPVRRELWGKCPACKRRSWMHVRPGPALRAFLFRG